MQSLVEPVQVENTEGRRENKSDYVLCLKVTKFSNQSQFRTNKKCKKLAAGSDLLNRSRIESSDWL